MLSGVSMLLMLPYVGLVSMTTWPGSLVLRELSAVGLQLALRYSWPHQQWTSGITSRSPANSVNPLISSFSIRGRVTLAYSAWDVLAVFWGSCSPMYLRTPLP